MYIPSSRCKAEQIAIFPGRVHLLKEKGINPNWLDDIKGNRRDYQLRRHLQMEEFCFLDVLLYKAMLLLEISLLFHGTPLLHRADWSFAFAFRSPTPIKSGVLPVPI